MIDKGKEKKKIINIFLMAFQYVRDRRLKRMKIPNIPTVMKEGWPVGAGGVLCGLSRSGRGL